MTSDAHGAEDRGRRITPADVQSVRFNRGTMLHPGYNEEEVDRFLNRTAQELARLYAEKAELRDQVHALQQQVEDASVPVPPSDQAVRLLATAQQTADAYVAEAEDFSRQMTADARARYEEQLKHARETAGGIIQAAHEAAARMVGGEPAGATEVAAPRTATTEELEEQVAYLKAFAQACRTQLRAYLEALLTDVETEWGRAEPSALPKPPLRTPAQRTAPVAESARRAPGNVAREMPLSDSTSEHPVVTADGTVEVVEHRG
ncbi:DivIVA domain-containing protein [Geodermatophilus sp. SYSU D00815]